MDEILKEMEKKRIYPSGAVNGRRQSDGTKWRFPDTQSSDSDDNFDDCYEQQFVKDELKRYFEPHTENKSKPDDFSMVSSVVGTVTESYPNIYDKYNFLQDLSIKKDLPIDSYIEKISSMIDTNQITVIEGPTGCGKTTQVPQIIMDKARERNQYCKIVVTQPRKIATINLAKRVCQERGWTMGTVCGYQIGLEKTISPDQIITYVTIGILLQKIIHAKSLKEYTHIVIDEIHERSQDMDFLLLLVRKYLFLNSPSTKVVLMSATINAGEFAHYFRRRSSSCIIPAPIITISENLHYQKLIYYLNDLQMCLSKMPQFDIAKPSIPDTVWETFVFLLKIFDKIDRGNKFGTVLVFLPGLHEIEEANKHLVETENKGNEILAKWEIVPLHSSFPNDEQAKAFLPRKDGWRRIILSTNIAESSVTVPDTSYVIDFCMSKSLTLDPVTNYSCLKLHWASHMNCDQRAGRAGRTCDGRVYRLVSSEFYKKEMDKTIHPEIVQAPLESVVLHAKLLDLVETPAQILALAMKPPNLGNIQKTIWKLKEIGGLLKTCRGNLSNIDGDITFLGHVMARLPIDVRLTKLIILGQLFSCLDETIIIAAGCSIQNIFAVPFQKKLESYKKQLLWADNSNSDLIAILNVYTVWQNMKRENAFQNFAAELDWCEKNFVCLKSLREWNLLIGEIKSRLQRMQIVEAAGSRRVSLTAAEKPTVLKIVMAGAFYPNFFVKCTKIDSEKQAVRVTGGRNPFSTVYLTGMDTNQPGPLYVRQIKKMIQENREFVSGNKIERDIDIHVGFDNSQKIYIEFRNSFQHDPVTVNVNNFEKKLMMSTITKVPKEVYESVRKRQLRYDFKLRVLHTDKAVKFYNQFSSGSSTSGAAASTAEDCTSLALSTESTNCFSSVTHCALPSHDTEFITIYISCYVDVGHFWAQNANDETKQLLERIFVSLNQQVLTAVGNEPLKIGKLYAAKFHTDGHFYRARLTTIAGRLNQVLFIDYGNFQEVTRKELFYLPQTPQCYMNPLAFQCTLHGIKPSYKKNPLGYWSDDANMSFKNLTDGILLYAEIYSVLTDVVELTLYRSEKKTNPINKYFLVYGLAEPCAPSLLSTQNHEVRLRNKQLGINAPKQERITYTNFTDPNGEEISKQFESLLCDNSSCYNIYLKGPYSPLEVKFTCCTKVGSGLEVNIDTTSVNCVTLDTEPESQYTRLLVAGYVGQNPERTRLSLRQTTLMPNVAGLPIMLAALFCPTMKVNVVDNHLTIGGVLFGLGCDQATGKSLYPPHDMVLCADTELTSNEIELVNTIRYLMNNGLRSMQVNNENGSNTGFYNAQLNIKRCLFDLINLERVPITENLSMKSDNDWMSTSKLHTLDPLYENVEGDVWELFSFVKLPKLDEYHRKVLNNLDDIKKLFRDDTKFQPISCILCNVDQEFTRYGDLRWHVISDDHKANVADFQSSLQNN